MWFGLLLMSKGEKNSSSKLTREAQVHLLIQCRGCRSRPWWSGYTSFPEETSRTLVHVYVSVAQSCPTHCDPVDCSPPGSSVHGIFQARKMEWVAISSSRGSSRLRDQTCIVCVGRQRILYCWATWEAHRTLVSWFKNQFQAQVACPLTHPFHPCSSREVHSSLWRQLRGPDPEDCTPHWLKSH